MTLFVGQEPTAKVHAPAGVPPHPVMEGWPLGFWLGDGAKHSPRWITADQEALVRLTQYAAAIPGHSATISIMSRPGEMKVFNARTGSEITTTETCWCVYTRGPGQNRENRVISALKELGCWNTKAARVPHAFINGNEQAKLGVLAGLIDSDGWLDTAGGHACYHFAQHGEEHKQIVHDARTIAISLGMLCGEISERWQEGYQNYRYHLEIGAGCERPDFQAMLMTRKRIVKMPQRYDSDARCITGQTAVGPASAVYLAVSGGEFQLNTGVVVNGAAVVEDEDEVADDEAE